jgi:hypothetical protein
MSKFKIEAKRTIWYEIEINADDELDALAELDEWIADDFEDYETNGSWEFEVVKEYDNA